MKARCPHCRSMEKVRTEAGRRVFARHETRKLGAYTAYRCDGVGEVATDEAVLAWAKEAEFAARQNIRSRAERLEGARLAHEEALAKARAEFGEEVESINMHCDESEAELRAIKKIRAKLAGAKASKVPSEDGGAK